MAANHSVIKLHDDLSIPLLSIWMEDFYKPLEILGSGAYSKVWKCQCFDSGNLVALKIIKIKFEEDRKIFLQSIGQEINTLQYLNEIEFQNVPRFLRAFAVSTEDPDHFKIILVLEYIDGVCLTKYFQKFHPLSNDQLNRLTYWLFSILDELHSINIVHRDIKPDNILVTEEGKYYLVDFGFSCSTKKAFGLPICHRKSGKGTEGFAAPEIVFRDYPDIESLKAADVFSAGATILTLMQPPGLLGNSNYVKQITQKIKVIHRPPLSLIIERCVELVASKRPTAEWVKGLLKTWIEN